VDKIRVGVVGVGSLGRHHARVYASLPRASLVGVADIVPERAKEIADLHATRAFTDYRQLLGSVDAVSIATPTVRHAEIGAPFLEQGVHVLVEKPISHRLEDADRLIRAARSGGRVLQVGHVERFNPAVQAVREIVRRPRFFEAHRLGVFTPRSVDIDVILDLMIHDLDIVRLMVPSPPAAVQAVGIAILTGRIDIANARIQFADGCVANLTASRVSTEKIRKLRLFHAREYISIDYTRQDAAILAVERDAGASGTRIVARKLSPPHREPLEAELDSFLSACQGRTPVACSGEEGRATLELALEVLGQAEQAQAREFDSV
jgi:predicted dehydrogenase